MFVLYTIEDNVRIDPQNLNKPTEKAIIHVLQQTFTDRVIHKVGLVISLYDVVSIGEGAVYPSDGGAHYKVTFRAIVFRPFPNELITGYVKEMNENGILVSLGFFSDIFIPKEMLQQPPKFHPSSSPSATPEWSWLQQGQTDLFYFLNQEIRFRVHDIVFHAMPSLQVQAEQRKANEKVIGTIENPHVPMEIVGRVDGPGLGMLAWNWGAGEEDK